ncbi:hypothetical protein QJQ45_013373 [Haematococcus lacustris]|nr:hypothetical protein QJQ45_013373 [Haematococcus lacustris]
MALTSVGSCNVATGPLPGLRDAGHGVPSRRSLDNASDEMVAFASSRGPDTEALASEMENAYAQAEQQRRLQSSHSMAIPEDGGPPSSSHPPLLADMLNISHVLTDGATAIVDDSFNKCFTSMAPDPWNWNAYLWPEWVLGVVLRYCILFPIRLVALLVLSLLVVAAFFVVEALVKPGPRRKQLEQRLVQVRQLEGGKRHLSGAFMLSWNAVVKYHGPKPTPGANRIWVSNHTSMIDYGIFPFAVIMQLHGGWVGFIQTRILNSLGCLWFNRNDLKDRHVVAARMREHASSADSVPLLIFPEGTCVNNEYCVLFKRGAFDLGATVCPIAIKYNKIFVDAFWNSRRQSFGQHLLRLMTSWALVCDVWFLEPQTRGPDETADQFAGRVQRIIAETAGLKVVPWDGYLKYYNLGTAKPGLVEKRRKVMADVLRGHLAHIATQQARAITAEGGVPPAQPVPPAVKKTQ